MVFAGGWTTEDCPTGPRPFSPAPDVVPDCPGPPVVLPDGGLTACPRPGSDCTGPVEVAGGPEPFDDNAPPLVTTRPSLLAVTWPLPAPDPAGWLLAEPGDTGPADVTGEAGSA
ncbi:hypothetical protein, partial [Amycolatopsis japonica]